MVLFAAVVFVSAFLLFQVQPMIAKMILPWFGGSVAVWITSMLFFQTALLGGYLYAHWLVRSFHPRMQAIVHGVLLAASLVLLPAAPAAGWKPSGSEEPITRILGLLAVSIGPPYFLLSATSPLFQAWYGRRYRAALPYRLFGLSNLASLLGLLAYPFFVEPNVTLRRQSLGWSAGYLLFAGLGILAAVTSSRGVPDTIAVRRDEGAEPPRPRAGEQVLWLLLAACSSTFLLAVTNHLTQNVASVPFLWVLPLSLYLLSFIITFDCERLYHRTTFFWLLFIALGGMAFGLVKWNSLTSLKLVIPAYAAGLFAVCMFCHGELVKRKPAPRHLTNFYVMLSVGGALGGVLVGLAAPALLRGYYELPAALVALAVLALFLIEYRGRPLTVAAGWVAAIGVLLLCVHSAGLQRESSLLMLRNFYGSLRVDEYDADTADEVRTLVHGTVNHGMQFTAPARRREHITYYGPESGVSLAVHAIRRSRIRVGVIGLGAGSLAAFSEPGDTFRFYEINPLVEELARTEFTYLSDARGMVEVVLGDGRLSLEREPDQHYDLLVADAFSGDAVPVHLLTKQAFELYFRHLKPSGILALNITNTHLDLAPVVEQLGRELSKHTVVVENSTDEDREIFHARWALVSSRPFTDPAILDAAEEPASRPGMRAWTDDYNNLFQVLKY